MLDLLTLAHAKTKTSNTTFVLALRTSKKLLELLRHFNNMIIMMICKRGNKTTSFVKEGKVNLIPTKST